MAREEAIAYIKAIKNGLHETGKDFPYRDEIIPVAKEALDMAIKALEQVSSSENPKVGHWEWNQYDANPKIGNFHCSLCHFIGRAYYDYCPGCGTKMSEIPTVAEGSEE